MTSTSIMYSSSRKLLVLAVAALICCQPVKAQDSAPDSKLTAIVAAQALDVESGTILQNPIVLIRGNRIEEFGASEIPPEAEVIDLGDVVILPGLIDAHTHLLLQPGYSQNNPILYKSIPYRTVEGVSGARATLEAGFTSVRDIDSEGAEWADVALRDGINDGLVVGQRMQVATLAVSITAGYMNQNGLAPDVDVTQFGDLVDSPDELVASIRKQIKYGADFIKLYATGTTRHINVDNREPLTQFSEDDISVAVHEAKRFRKYVAAHAYGGAGATNAINAGVHSIEHGMLLDDEQLQAMVDKGIYWVPTLSVYMGNQPPEEWDERRNLIVTSHERAFRKGVELGVKIAYGTDAGALPHGDNAIDFPVMLRFGMPAIDVVRSATLVAAEMMGWAGQVGTLQAGAYADIIAVAENPLENIETLGNVVFVMKGGEVVR
jgi:imidazolonepropionase-like amidohydrolase